MCGFSNGSVVKSLPANAGDTGLKKEDTGGEDSLEEEMATHSSILAWENHWIEKHTGLQSTGWQKSWTWITG